MVIQRQAFKPIRDHLQQKEITLITGPRQVGKTTLMKQLEGDLKNSSEKTLFLDLDRDQDKPFFESQNRLIQRIQYEIGNAKGYVFIDEIQRKEDAGIFLKGVYDMNLPYKFIVSGSGSLELKEKIHESLAGRKQIFELWTLNFEEFLNFKTEYKYTTPEGAFRELATYFNLHKGQASQYLEEYLNFGGYPRIVLEPEINVKRALIDEIYRSYLEKDLVVLLNLQKTEQSTQLVRIMASQTGNLVNITELSNTLDLAAQTIKDYLWYLEKTFIIQKITPYFRNVRKEITKASTYYFVDLGLKNFASNQFGNALAFPGTGFLFENFVYRQLKERMRLTSNSLHFWRSKDKAEVDFVINTGVSVIPIEVKYTVLRSPETTRSFQSFILKYAPKEAFVVHLGESMHSSFKNTTIHFIPFYNFDALFSQ